MTLRHHAHAALHELPRHPGDAGAEARGMMQECTGWQILAAARKLAPNAEPGGLPSQDAPSLPGSQQDAWPNLGPARAAPHILLVQM